jgi:DNA/RNA-binding domain of Phe-tRNA-synthetase-like protein
MIDLVLDAALEVLWSGEAVLAAFSMEEYAGTQNAGPEVEKDISSVIYELRDKRRTILDEPRVQSLRRTFRAMPDMDPARYRPASESLIRRCLEKGMFRIAPLVDVNNLLSVRLRVPLGIYDLDRIPSSVWTYRIGHPSETYYTFSNQVKNADGKLVLADSAGVIGSPVADSGRASIRGETARVSVVAYLPFDTTEVEAEALIREVEQGFVRHFHPSRTRLQVLTRST